MTATVIYRVQDAEGRGPYRPLFSQHWVDADHDERNPPLEKEFPWLTLAHFRLRARNDAYGFGFRTLEKLARWFSQSECIRLEAVGFNVVAMRVQELIAEGEVQVLFWRCMPLRQQARLVSWAEVRDVRAGRLITNNEERP